MTRVLIVEDHASLREMLAELIERTDGLELCGQAESAEAALDFLGQAQPELAVIDVSLPGMNGIELVETLLKQRPRTLCVMLTGHRSSGYADAARAAGAKAYVEKSQVHEFVQILRHVIDGGSRFP